MSGENVSNEKSRVFFSPNISCQEREVYCDILNFWSTHSLGKYLGFPIKHTSVPQVFGSVIDRVQSRFAGWNAHLLSFARRLVLTQAVTSAIPSYTMQCIALPSKVLSNIDKLR